MRRAEPRIRPSSGGHARPRLPSVVTKKRRRRQLARASAQRHEARRAERAARRRRRHLLLAVAAVVVVLVALVAWVALHQDGSTTRAAARASASAGAVDYAGAPEPAQRRTTSTEGAR
jgi:peptidyl-prolyl cis-trans isomerase B (cyclophilin B)